MKDYLRRLACLAVLAAGGIAAAQDYAADPAFNAGNYFVDAFSGSATRSYRARNLVRLGNGDVIVAGLVPRRDSSGGDSTALGLVRYDSAGVRQTWGNPGAYGAFANQYVIYDPASLAPRPVEDVKDIVTIGSRVFVLVEVATYRLRNEPPFGAYFTGHAVDVLVFGVDGAYQSSAMMIHDDNVDARDVYGGGIAVYSNLQLPEVFSLVYGGTSVENGIQRATFRRYTVAGNGSLADQTGVVYPNPSNYCSAPQRCEIAGVALGGRASGSSVPRIYLGGSHFVSNWDFMAMRVSASGAPATDFGVGGVRRVGFNISGDTLNDGGRAIVVKAGGIVGGNTDEIYIAGDVSVRCGDGVGVIKLLADGNPDITWGPGDLGRVYFGSAQVPPDQPCFLPATNRFAHGLALQDGTLTLVGQTNRGSLFVGGELQVDSYFAVLGSDGYVAFDAEFPYREGGTRTRHSGLWDVDDAGNGAFTATGDVRFYASAGGGTAGNMQYATLRLAPRADLIFANGFQ
jgi:hypothetical protein